MAFPDPILPATAHLDDLQSEIEAEARQLRRFADAMWKLCDWLRRERLPQTAQASALSSDAKALQQCVSQQRHMMRALRHDVRRLIDRLKRGKRGRR
jgi:hypothetical protein